MIRRAPRVVIALLILLVLAAPVYAELDALFEFDYLWQSTGEGEYYNAYHCDVTNTGDVPIFGIFVRPDMPCYTGSFSNDNSAAAWDAWEGWSWAAYNPPAPGTGPPYWYMANSGDQYIVELNDVPNPNGWNYNNPLGIWWNASHDPGTHTDDEDTLGPADQITDLYCTIWGVDEGDPTVPPMTVMLAGVDAGQVVTRNVRVPEPATLGLLAAGAVALLNRRRRRA